MILGIFLEVGGVHSPQVYLQPNQGGTWDGYRPNYARADVGPFRAPLCEGCLCGFPPRFPLGRIGLPGGGVQPGNLTASQSPATSSSRPSAMASKAPGSLHSCSSGTTVAIDRRTSIAKRVSSTARVNNWSSPEGAMPTTAATGRSDAHTGRDKSVISQSLTPSVSGWSINQTAGCPASTRARPILRSTS